MNTLGRDGPRPAAGVTPFEPPRRPISCATCSLTDLPITDAPAREAAPTSRRGVPAEQVLVHERRGYVGLAAVAHDPCGPYEPSIAALRGRAARSSSRRPYAGRRAGRASGPGGPARTPRPPGTTRKPPHSSGTGTSSGYAASAAAVGRLQLGAGGDLRDWCEAWAPSWEPRGRDGEVGVDVGPRQLASRPRRPGPAAPAGATGRAGAQCGLPRSSAPLREPRLVKKTQPVLRDALEQHHPRRRRDRRPRRRRPPSRWARRARRRPRRRTTAGTSRTGRRPGRSRPARRRRTRGAGRRRGHSRLDPTTRHAGPPRPDPHVRARTGEAESVGGEPDDEGVA